MIASRSRWDDGTLRIPSADDDGALAWIPGEPFHWTVGPVERPTTVPPYVFEPRPTERIIADLETATDQFTIKRLQEEQRLCARPHVVYAAFYGTLAKVGMTSAVRLQERLQEQGADAGFVIAQAADRAAAREIENSVSFQFKLPQWRTHKELLPQWTKPVDLDRIATRAHDLRRRLSPHYDGGELLTIEHPLPVLASRPHRAQIEGVHTGTAIGAKGTFFVYEETTTQPGRLDVGHSRLLALRHTDLEGRSVIPAASD